VLCCVLLVGYLSSSNLTQFALVWELAGKVIHDTPIKAVDNPVDKSNLRSLLVINIMYYYKIIKHKTMGREPDENLRF